MPQKPAAMKPPLYGRPSPKFARLGFFDCFFEAKSLLGSDYWLFLGLFFVGSLISGVVPLVLLGPLYCGMGFCFLAKEQGRQPSFELLFKGFDHFVETLIPILLYSLGILVIIPFYFAGFFGGLLLIGTGEELPIILGICLFMAGVSVMIVGSTFVGTGWMFSCFLVAEYQLGGMDAFTVSLSGIRKNLFGLFGIMIASTIIGSCALLACYIPFILMLPIFFGAHFICYRKIFRPPAKSGEKQDKIDLPN